MLNEILIDDKEFEYLIIQRGTINSLSFDRRAWEFAYNQSLENIFNSLKDYLPKRCFNLIDIGSGLGGINILLSRHYNFENKVTLLDGENDSPKVKVKDQTYSNSEVAKKFLEKNGITNHAFYAPDTIKSIYTNRHIKYDLVVSFASYAFHYHPEMYGELLKNNLTMDARCIFDVRKDKPEWESYLDYFFLFKKVIYTDKKYNRIVYSNVNI